MGLKKYEKVRFNKHALGQDGLEQMAEIGIDPDSTLIVVGLPGEVITDNDINPDCYFLRLPTNDIVPVLEEFVIPLTSTDLH